MADALRDSEVVAETATPTPGSTNCSARPHETGRRISIVSNNALEAVRSYLELHGIVELVDLVVGRDNGMDPHLIKPDPHLVRLALNDPATDARAAVFIGDQTAT